MKKLVMYDAKTGNIQQIMTPAPGREAAKEIVPSGLSAIRTAQDVSGKTHCVRRGRLELKSQTERNTAADAEAWRKLRTRRYTLLTRHCDTINPMRWDAMTGQERAAWQQYRQALLDLPANTTDPRNPQWPEVPQ